MRVSSIGNSPNFGKTVRVNMSIEEAFKLVSCINAKDASGDEFKLQQEAKLIFDDTNKGTAVFCSPDEGKSCYILSGRESNELRQLKKTVLSLQEGISSFYEDGPFADKNIEYICKKERGLIKNLIRSTKEPYILTMFNDKETGVPRLHKLSILG